MRVDVLDEPAADWDAFVESTPGGALGHAAAWPRALRDGYGLQTRCLTARRGGDLIGVLPLVLFRGLDGRRELVSMPFLDTGGILAREPSAADALRGAALELVHRVGARALELRPLALEPDGPPAEQPRVDLVLRLESSEEAQWKALGAKVRNQTRKAQREDLSLGADEPHALLEGFYDPFRRNMRDLGSPVHARRFFAATADAFGERLRFVVASRAGRPVGGLVAIHFAGAVTVPWASTLRSERSRCPNNLIYWEALRWAISRGVPLFDFGRSPRDSGSYRFKAGWGARERPLAWVRLAPDGSALPPAAAGDRPLLQRLASLWRHLPLAWTTALGPSLRRRIAS